MNPEIYFGELLGLDSAAAASYQPIESKLKGYERLNNSLVRFMNYPSDVGESVFIINGPTVRRLIKIALILHKGSITICTTTTTNAAPLVSR